MLVSVLQEREEPMNAYRHNQIIQVTTASGSRFCYRGTIEAIRERSNGAGLMGYFHFQQSQWRVHRLACGEWMGVDADGKRTAISHWLLDEEIERIGEGGMYDK
jgi:hypothetical protein